MSEDVTPGARLRMFREAAGKSRPVLAGLMGCSAESVKAIEVGRRELTMAVRAARALGIRDLAALYGPEVSYTVVERPTHVAVPEVRRALVMRRMEDGEPQSTSYVRAALDSAWQVWHTSSKQRTETGKVLPRLILDARRAATRHQGQDRRVAHRLLAETYHLVSRGVLRGFVDSLAYVLVRMQPACGCSLVAGFAQLTRLVSWATTSRWECPEVLGNGQDQIEVLGDRIWPLRASGTLSGINALKTSTQS